MAVEPKPAATLILLRPVASGSGFETLLMRRHGKSGFMGGVHVFPGGKVDESDAHPGYGERLGEFDWHGAASRMRSTAESARAHWVAALRETFEEAGLLLASPPAEAKKVITLQESSLKERFAGLRKLLTSKDDPTTLLDIAAKEKLTLRPDLIVYHDHWITPEFEQKRFDTRFFAARAPEGQETTHDERELTEWSWLTPQEAIGRFERGEIQLAPPTMIQLLRLSNFNEIDTALAGLSRRKVVPTLPKLKMIEGKAHSVLPGHPDYGEDVGDVGDDSPVAFLIAGAGKWSPVWK